MCHTSLTERAARPDLRLGAMLGVPVPRAIEVLAGLVVAVEPAHEAVSSIEIRLDRLRGHVCILHCLFVPSKLGDHLIHRPRLLAQSWPSLSSAQVIVIPPTLVGSPQGDIVNPDDRYVPWLGRSWRCGATVMSTGHLAPKGFPSVYLPSLALVSNRLRSIASYVQDMPDSELRRTPCGQHPVSCRSPVLVDRPA